MKKNLLIVLFLLSGFIPSFAQNTTTLKTEQDMDRIELCKKNYTTLFGDEALIGQGADPEMMDIPQKAHVGFPPAMKTLKIIQDVQSPTDQNNNKVRLSKIVVDPAQLESYNNYLKEEIEASMRLEPGVLTLYAVSEKEHPNRITILEIYANENAYQSHIKTPHFQKYKQGTLDMVKELELIDTNPLIPGLKIK